MPDIYTPRITSIATDIRLLAKVEADTVKQIEAIQAEARVRLAPLRKKLRAVRARIKRNEAYYGM